MNGSLLLEAREIVVPRIGHPTVASDFNITSVDHDEGTRGQHTSRQVAQEPAAENGPTRWQQDARATAFAALLTLGSGLMMLDGWLTANWFGLAPVVVVVALLVVRRWRRRRVLLPRDASRGQLFWMAVWVGLALLLTSWLTG
jgi:cytochrome b561